MNSSVDRARDAFVDRMGQFGSELGLNPAVGSIYALLYMSDHPLSLEEICQSCGMSKGNGSVNLREMERWEAVRKVRVRGDRRSFYEANLNILEIIRSQLREGLERRMSEAERALEGIEKALGAATASVKDDDKNAVKVMRKRLAKVRETEAAVKTLLDTFL